MSVELVEQPKDVHFKEPARVIVKVTPLGDVSLASVKRALGSSYATVKKLEKEGRLTARQRLTRTYYPVEQVKALLGMA